MNGSFCDISLRIAALRRPAPRKAFTVLELLVVIAVIAVLASMLLTAIPHLREQVRRAVCASNLRQHGAAIAAQAQDHRGVVQATIRVDVVGWYPFLMWRDSHPSMAGERSMQGYLDYLEGCANIEFAANPGGAWTVVGTGSGLFHCPSKPGDKQIMGVDWAPRSIAAGNPLLAIGYCYYGRTDVMPPGFVSDPSRLTQRRLEPNRLLMSDMIYRWHVDGAWTLNHGEHRAQAGANGPDIQGANQLFGDGSVRWKTGKAFDPQALASSWASAPALWADAIGSDGFFF